MKYLIPKKYPETTSFTIPILDESEKITNSIFILLLNQGDLEGLDFLFKGYSPESWEILEKRYPWVMQMKGEYLKKFPKYYQMNEIIKKNAIQLAINISFKNKRDEQKKWAIIEKLIKNGADALQLLCDDYTPIEKFKQIIEWGADINTHYNGFSALHAVIANSAKARYLIEKGADVNRVITDPAIGTPLHILLANELIPSALNFIHLIKDKLDINIKDGEKKTPLLLAAKIRSKIVVKILLENFKGKVDVNAEDANRRTPLHFACAYGDVEMAQALIAADADINAKDHRENTPLHYANAKKEAIAAMLMSIEIHPDRDINARRNGIVDSQGNSLALDDKEILATKSNVREKIDNLIASVNRKDNPNRNKDVESLLAQQSTFIGKSLLTTCLEGHQDIVKLLLKSKANVFEKNSKGNKPSDIAQEEEIKKLLLEAEKNVIPNWSLSTETGTAQNLPIETTIFQNF